MAEFSPKDPNEIAQLEQRVQRARKLIECSETKVRELEESIQDMQETINEHKAKAGPGRGQNQAGRNPA